MEFFDYLSDTFGVNEPIFSADIKFEDYPKKAWCIDGEKLDRAVLNYEIHNIRNVKIMMPRKNIDKIFVNKKV